METNENDEGDAGAIDAAEVPDAVELPADADEVEEMVAEDMDRELTEEERNVAVAQAELLGDI